MPMFLFKLDASGQGRDVTECPVFLCNFMNKNVRFSAKFDTLKEESLKSQIHEVSTSDGWLHERG